MPTALTFISSLVFGMGLIVSGLTNPIKVLNFLDVAGEWDPSLFLTLGAAVATTAIGYATVLRRARPIFADAYQLPAVKTIDARLIVGSTLFGIGWGLVGYCPGPAIVALSSGNSRTLIFVLAMLAGMVSARSLPAFIRTRRLNLSLRRI